MKKFSDLANEWKADPKWRAGYDAMAAEFELPLRMAETRRSLGVTQQQLAERMHTTQSAISRLESGSQDPTLSTLTAYAEALGLKLVIALTP